MRTQNLPGGVRLRAPDARPGEAISDPGVTEFLVNQVVESRPTSIADFAKQVATERVETAKILTGLNIPTIK